MTKEQAKDKVTVTVTKNGEQVFSTTENIVFIVGEHTGLMAADCTAVELFTFAPPHFRAIFKKHYHTTISRLQTPRYGRNAF